MRALSAFAVAALLAGASATIAVAEPAPNSLVLSAERSAPTLIKARNDFVRAMGDMEFELRQAVNPNEIREITARYQTRADALADLVEARLAAGEPVPNRYRNPMQFREYPERVRHEVLRTRLDRDPVRRVSIHSLRLS